MRPPDELKAELLRQWLTRAEEDFAVAERLLADKLPYLVTIGFHAQQAAEKFLKALLVARQIEFPKTHDLGQLLDLVALDDVSLSSALRTVTALNPYGAATRYPADLPELTEADAQAAVTLAALVRQRVRRALGLTG